MTSLEKEQFSKMQDDLSEVKVVVNKLERSLSELFTALVGNKLSQDGGLVRRVMDLEEVNELQQKEIEDLKKSITKADVYTKIVWGICTTLGGGILAWVLKTVLG